MDRRRAAGALLALAACIACSAAAPTASNHTSLDLYEGTPEGCYYNFQHYGEGDRIMTNEPCLNCTCHNRMLMCYLRVCPFTKAIGQDCTVEKRADQCCPIVTCPDVPVDLLTSTSTTSPAEYGATGLGKLDKYGCSISGKYFPEGSKVPPTPNKPCEHCYCIRNMTTCVMQECTLHVDGCTPIYHKDVCCPVRYSCDHPEDEMPLLDDMSTTVRPTPGFLLTTTTISPVTQMTQDCVHDDQIFADGALIKTEKACEHCYCMKGDIVCVVQECGTPMENEGKNCTSMPPREGQCCPDTYICEGDELSSELPTEYTTESIVEKLTTLSPPRRAGIEGSGYRNEPDEAPYTEMPTIEPDVEGSGEEQETAKPLGSDEIIPGSEDGDQYIYVTTKSPKFEEREHTTTEINKNNIPDLEEKTIGPQVYLSTTNAPVREEVEKQTTSEITEEEILEPQKHIPTTSAPESYETVTTEVGESLNTVPDVVPKEEIGEPNEYVPSTTRSPMKEESGILSPIEGEEVEPTLLEQDVTINAHSETPKPEHTTLSSINEIKNETATSIETSNVVTEKEFSETDSEITGTTSATEIEKTESPAPQEGEKESSEPEQFTPSTTSYSVQEGEKLTTEPDHAQNTVAVAEDESTYTHLHIPTTTIGLLSVDEERTTVSNLEQNIVTEKVIIDDILAPHEHIPAETPALEDNEFTTEEPDKGLNTIPSKIDEETSSESSLPGKTTTHIVETKATESSISTDALQTQEIDIKPIETMTLLPESFITKGDQYTITTEPSFRKEDESSVSTEKPKDFEPTTVKSEFVDEELIPTSEHDERYSTSSGGPTIEEELTTSVPEFTEEIAETVGSKQTTTESVLVTSIVTESLPDKVPEPSSEKYGELSPSTEKSADVTSFVQEIIETPEEPSRIPGEGDCLLNGLTYRNNSVVPSTNNCHTGCRCASSIIKCDPIICSPPPDYMDNCQSIYDSPDSCCPTYVCDHPRETVPPQSDNQMSGTESLMPSPTIECHGDQCELSEPAKQPTEPSKLCTSGSCLTGTDLKPEIECGSEGCADISQKPSVEQAEGCTDGKCEPESCANGECQLPQTEGQVSPVKPCEGDRCEKVDEVISPQCKNEEDCKTVETPVAPIPCEGESCKKIDCGDGGCDSNVILPPQDTQLVSCKEEDGCKPQDVPVSDCTGDEPCRRKEISASDEKLPTKCEGSNCKHEMLTPAAEDVINLSTELPLPDQTPSEEVTEKVIPAEEETVTEISDSHISTPEDKGETPVKDIENMDTYTTEGLTDNAITETDIQKEKPSVIEEYATKKPTVTEEGTETSAIIDEGHDKPTIIETEGTEEPAVVEEGTQIPTMIEDGKDKPAEFDEENIKKPTIVDKEGTRKPFITEEEITTKPASTEVKGTDKPFIAEAEDTEKPIINEKEGTMKPVTESEGTELPAIIGEEGTEKPSISDDEAKDKPVLVDEEGTNKPVIFEDEGIKKPAVTEEEGTTKPAISDKENTENPAFTEESTEEPDVVEKESTEKSSAVEEGGTEKPALIDEEGNVKPSIDEEGGTEKPALIDEEGKVKPPIDEEGTEKPALIDDNEEVKSTIYDVESTEKPAVIEEGTDKSPMVDEDDKDKTKDGEERPTVIEEKTTEKPEFIEAEGTAKPVMIGDIDKEKPVGGEEQITEKSTVIEEKDTESPLVVNKEGEQKPAVNEEGQDKPAIVNEQYTEKPVVEDDIKVVVEQKGTEKPIISDEEESEKTTDDEHKEKPSVVTEDETIKPALVDEEKSSESPTVAIEEGTEQPGIILEKDMEKPAMVSEDRKEEPGVDDKEGTKKPVLENEGTEEPALIDEEGKLKPSIDEGHGTEKPANVEEGTEKATMVGEEDKEKPTELNKEGIHTPAIVDEEGTGKPIITDEEITTKPTTTEDKETDKLDIAEKETTEEPVIVEKEGTVKPFIEREGTELPAIIGEEDTEKPTIVDEEGIKKPVTVEGEFTKKPAVTEVDGTTKPAISDKESTDKPAITEEGTEEPDFEKESTETSADIVGSTERPALIDEEGNVKPSIDEEEDTEKPDLVDEEGNVKPSIDIREGTEKPALIEEEGKVKPSIDEEGTEKPASIDEEGKVKPSIDDEEGTEKPASIDEEGKVKPSIDEESTENPALIDEEGKVKPSIDEEGTEKPALIDEEGKVKPSIDEEGTEKPASIDEEGKVKPSIDEESTEKPALIDEEGKVKPSIDEEGTEKPALIDEEGKPKPSIDEEGTEKPASIDEEGKVKPSIDEESTEKPALIDEEGKVKPSIDEEGTEKPALIDEEGKLKPSIDEEGTEKPASIDEEGKVKPSIDEEGTEKPALIDEEGKLKPTIDEEGTEKPVSIDEEGKVKPSIDEESTEKPALIDEEGKLKPSIDEEGTEKPASIDEEGKVKPSIDEESTEKPAFIDEVSKMKPSIDDEEGTEKPAVNEAGTEKSPMVDEEDKDKPAIIDDEIKKEPTGTELDSTEKPQTHEEEGSVTEVDSTEKSQTHEEEGSGTEVDSTEKPQTHDEEGSGVEVDSTEKSQTTEKEGSGTEISDGLVSELVKEVQPTESTVPESEKITKKPIYQSQTTLAEDENAFSTESNAVESVDVSKSPQEVLPSETPEIKITGVEESNSEVPVIVDQSGIPVITTESLMEHESTTKIPLSATISEEEEKQTVTVSAVTEERIEATSPKVDITDMKKAGSTVAQDMDITEASLSTKTPELHEITDLVEKATEPGSSSEQEVFTDTSELESPTTKSSGLGPVIIEPQDGIEPEKPDSIATGKPEEESTTKIYEEEKIKPVPESHVTDSTSASPEQSETTDRVPEVPKKTYGDKPQSPELHGTEPEKITTQLPVDVVEKEIKTEHPEIYSTDTEKTIMETEGYSVTEPVRRFTEIEDPFVTGQEDIVTEYPEESTEHRVPITTEKIYESDVSASSSEKPTDTKLPEQSEKTSESDKPITGVQEQSTQTPEADKEKPDIFESPATEIPISVVTESQGMLHVPGKDVTSYEEKTTSLPDLLDQTHKGTTFSEGEKEKPESVTEIPQHQVTSSEEYFKVTESYITEQYVTEAQESSTKLKEQEITDAQAITTEVPKLSIKEGDSDTKAPEVMYTESYDLYEKEPSITEMQKQSTESPSPSEEVKTEMPGKQATSEVPQSMVTEHQEGLGEETTVSSIPKEESSYKPEMLTTQFEEITKTPEMHISGQEEIRTETPVLITESVEISTKETEPEITKLEDKTTKLPEEAVTEKQDTATTLRESSAVPQAVTTEKAEADMKLSEITTVKQTEEVMISTEHTSAQTEISETTPYLIELEEHTHKIAEDVTTILPFEEQTSSATAEEFTHKIEEHLTTESPFDQKRTTEQPDAGKEPQVSELTTKMTDEKIETATKEAEVTSKPIEETSPEDVFEKISESVPIVETTPGAVQNLGDTYSGDHKDYTTSAPTQVTEEYTPSVVTDSEKLPIYESDIAVPTEKESSSTEKPLHPIVLHKTTASEDEFIFSTTKATTLQHEEEILTPVSDDKFVKPDKKPSETSELPPSSTTTEISKPGVSDMQPTDEIPAPEEDGHFPPSGTSGYGEPDYVEEDQAFGPGTCRYGGKVYVSAQQIPRDDPCDFCFCFRSDIICLQQSCPPPIHGCHEEPIQGFCCPRYECPVSMATTVNVTTTTTTTTTTLPPHFPTHSYKGQAQRRGCQIKGHTYKVGEVVRSSSGPCLHCTCGGDGQMKCDPKACTPEPMLRQMIAAAVSAKRRR